MKDEILKLHKHLGSTKCDRTQGGSTVGGEGRGGGGGGGAALSLKLSRVYIHKCISSCLFYSPLAIVRFCPSAFGLASPCLLSADCG